MARKSTDHDFFTRNTMHKLPVLITSAPGTPASINNISDKDTLYETRLNAQAAVQAMHKVLRSEYGSLDLAPKPVWGDKIPLRIKIESKNLFGESHWHEVLENILKKDFIGFFPGATVEVTSVPGMMPICYMTCLAFKSANTQDLQTNPIVEATFTMRESRKKVKCSVSFLEMPLACPFRGEPAVALQILQPYLAHKDFAGITARYKEELTVVLHRGIWEKLTQEEVMERFTICKVPRSQKLITGTESKKVFVLEVYGFSDGDVNHIINSIKLKDRITVQCCARDKEEDEAGDTKYPPAFLIYHSNGKSAVKATIDQKHKTVLDDIKSAASRVDKLKEMEGMIIEARQACFDPAFTSNERIELMRTAICETLRTRAQEIVESMMDSHETEEGLLWKHVSKDSASCVEAIVEKVANRIGRPEESVCLANFEIKFYKEKYAKELIMYNKIINKFLPAVKENSWCEIHPFYTDQTEDARMVERYTEKVKKTEFGQG